MKKPNFLPFPNLYTKKFQLRQLRNDDANEIFTIRSDEGIARFLDRSLAKSVDDACQFIQKINTSISKNELIYWGVTPKELDKLIGTICLWKISKQQSKAEIGFELLPAHQGRGVMQEVIPVVLEYGFDNLKLKTIEGETTPDNIKSIKLLEKFGFVLSRSMDRTLVYSITKHAIKK